MLQHLHGKHHVKCIILYGETLRVQQEIGGRGAFDIEAHGLDTHFPQMGDFCSATAPEKGKEFLDMVLFPVVVSPVARSISHS